MLRKCLYIDQFYFRCNSNELRKSDYLFLFYHHPFYPLDLYQFSYQVWFQVQVFLVFVTFENEKHYVKYKFWNSQRICRKLSSHLCARLINKALPEDFTNRPSFDEIIDYSTDHNNFWWRGYSNLQPSNRTIVMNLLQVRVITYFC